MGIVFDEDGRAEVQQEESKGKIRFWDAFRIPGILEFSVSMFFSKLVMSAMFYWTPVYLREQMGFDKQTALDIFTWFNAGTFVGNIGLGLGSDLFPLRSPLYLVGMVLASSLTFALGG